MASSALQSKKNAAEIDLMLLKITLSSRILLLKNVCSWLANLRKGIYSHYVWPTGNYIGIAPAIIVHIAQRCSSAVTFILETQGAPLFLQQRLRPLTF